MSQLSFRWREWSSTMLLMPFYIEIMPSRVKSRDTEIFYDGRHRIWHEIIAFLAAILWHADWERQP